MKQKLHQQGFSLIIAMLAILVIFSVGFGVWYVSSKNSSEKASSGPASQSQAKQTSKPKLQPTHSPEADNYLVIKEWRVRITLPKTLMGDISYYEDTKAHEDLGGPIKITFLSKAFSQGNLKCSVVEHGPRGLVSIYREVDGEGGETKEPQPFKRIDKTRYYFTETACTEAINREGSAQDRQLLDDLKEAVSSTLETISNQ